MTLPSLFLGHGAPDLPLSTTPARAFTEGLGGRFPDARAVLAVSAHWEAPVNTIGISETPGTIHDFYGFDPALYAMRYPARTSDPVIDAVAEVLTEAGIGHARDAERGYDHGVWVPLMLAFPQADIPVVQLSLRRDATAAENFRLGQALSPLRERGVLIVGSGSTVHNLHALGREGSPAPDWAQAFDAWITEAVTEGDVETLLRFPAEPETARIAHPTPEHLMPLYVALGAGGGRGRVLHHSFSWGSIGMTSFAFEG